MITRVASLDVAVVLCRLTVVEDVVPGDMLSEVEAKRDELIGK